MFLHELPFFSITYCNINDLYIILFTIFNHYCLGNDGIQRSMVTLNHAVLKSLIHLNDIIFEK